MHPEAVQQNTSRPLMLLTPYRSDPFNPFVSVFQLLWPATLNGAFLPHWNPKRSLFREIELERHLNELLHRMAADERGAKAE
jgi:hypothetical protein